MNVIVCSSSFLRYPKLPTASLMLIQSSYKMPDVILASSTSVALPTIGSGFTREIIRSDDTNITVVFGVLGVVVAFIGIGLAALQLRHMRQKRKTYELYELA